MFNKVSYRRGVIEGVILYTLGRLGALITPAFFPDWVFVAAPLLFLTLQFLIAPLWTTRRIQSTRRERLSKRLWLLGPRLAGICFAIDLVLSLVAGQALFTFTDVQRGPVLYRLFATGANHLSLLDFAFYELRSAALLLAFFTLTVICTRLAQGGFLRFTMPSGGNRVTL
jgi:predicted lysophospholipase L1 biosynthesis ABC-type transport system permease subunit